MFARPLYGDLGIFHNDMCQASIKRSRTCKRLYKTLSPTGIVSKIMNTIMIQPAVHCSKQKLLTSASGSNTRNLLQEKENILLRGQASGEQCLPRCLSPSLGCTSCTLVSYHDPVKAPDHQEIAGSLIIPVRCCACLGLFLLVVKSRCTFLGKTKF